MRILSLIIIAISVFLIAWFIPSPHGADFKISCNVCHSPKGWKLDKDIYSFNHSKTKLPLLGQHTKTDCKLCHPTLVFSEAKAECVSCHKDVHESSVGPECNRCHTNNSWLVQDITRVHQQSRFPLVGVHSTVDCNQCHKSETFLKFEVLGADCFSCHSDLYAATTQPNHKSSEFSTQCNDCHSIYSKNWSGTNFNHNFFPLKQGHEGVACLKCHTNGQFTKIPTECFTCHQTDYNTTSNPNHLAANFPTTCISCHTISPGWKPTSFNHSNFPLTQGHALTDCAKCHVNGNYSNIPTDCFTCHQTDYNATTNPNHQSANFPTNCISCHTTSPGWKPTSFSHSNFPLTQGHALTDCAKCHVNGNYSNTPTDCFVCHQTDYNATTNPNHKAVNFPTTCSTCHTTTPGWKPATFNHTNFPLTQGHAITDCAKCHVNGNYSNTPTDCFTCHQTDYNSTINPNHKAVNFPTTCSTCHTTTPGWKPATFDHSSFPLSQGHAITDCAKCHVNGNYTNVAKDCITCHQANYNATSNPIHSALNFSTVCTECHTTTPGWKPASYKLHDALSFPIYSGSHRGQWSSCIDCHSNTSNYKAFSCTNCHEHNKTDMDQKHSGESGYTYSSTACLRCHPRGSSK